MSDIIDSILFSATWFILPVMATLVILCTAWLIAVVINMVLDKLFHYECPQGALIAGALIFIVTALSRWLYLVFQR